MEDTSKLKELSLFMKQYMIEKDRLTVLGDKQRLLNDMIAEETERGETNQFFMKLIMSPIEFLLGAIYLFGGGLAFVCIFPISNLILFLIVFIVMCLAFCWAPDVIYTRILKPKLLNLFFRKRNAEYQDSCQRVALLKEKRAELKNKIDLQHEKILKTEQELFRFYRQITPGMEKGILFQSEELFFEQDDNISFSDPVMKLEKKPTHLN